MSQVRPRIHFHSDCAFFAGCENMLVNFWSSAALRGRFDISFSYRDSHKYREGLTSRTHLDFPVHSLRFPDASEVLPLRERWPRMIRRALRFGSRLVFTVPLLVYEVWILARLLRRVAPDVLHINNGGYPGALSARAAAVAGTMARVPRVIMVVNNLAAGYGEPLRWLEYPLDRFVARSVAQFITGSRVAATGLKAVLRLPAEKCLAIHNGIKRRETSETIRETRERFGLRGFGGVVFGIVAVMEARKGHAVLLQALVKLQRDEPELARNARLLIEGDGPLRAELERYVRENDLEHLCVFTGTQANIMNVFAAMDVLVLPSVDHEDFPNVILEAMACERAAIASRLAGTPEQVVDSETGYLVTPGDVTELSAAMARFCADRGLPLRMGRRGLERFEREFTAERAVSQYVALYGSLIEAQNK